MAVSLKYAVIERERRFLVRSIPSGVTAVTRIVDRYIEGSRLRLREMHGEEGQVIRKLGQKIRIGEDPSEIACTSIYLDDAEWRILSQLPSRVLNKRRHHVERNGTYVAIDQLEDGTLLAEMDDRDQPPAPVPSWLDVVAEVTADEAWTGRGLADDVQTRGSSNVAPVERT